MTTESTSADDAARRDGSRLSEGRGVRPHRPHWTVRNCVWGGMAWTVSLTTPTKLELGARLYSRREVDAMLASELERIAHEPPVSGNKIAQARVLLAAAQIRRA